jgi:hypothetical protein
MKGTKISLFKELYYWMYFYIFTTIERVNKYQNSRFGACVLLSALRMVNLTSIWIFIEYILKSIGFQYDQNVTNKVFSFCLFIFMISDWIYFYQKSNSIIPICEQFSKKRRITGKIKFWIYVIFTWVIFWCVNKYTHGD